MPKTLPAPRRAIRVAAGRGRPWQTVGIAVALAASAFATRLPWLGSAGESDSARYVLGVWQWLRLGAGAPFIYAKVMSPGYYAGAVWLVRHTGVGAQALLSQFSLWAAVLTAPLAYAIGRQFTGEIEAAAGTLLWLLSPGAWWLGLEAHPQGVALLCGLAALACFLPTRAPHRGLWRWTALAALWFGLGLLLKSDLVLLGAIFPALHLRRRAWRRVAAGMLVPIGGLGLFYVGRQFLLGLTWGSAQHETTAAVAQFLSWPHGTAILKQFLPLMTAPGLMTLALTALALLWAGLSRGEAAGAWRQRWGWLLAAWVIPQLGFWLLIRGNNARHMANFILLPLWAALDWAWTQRPQRLAAFRCQRPRRAWALALVCLLALGTDALVPPPSSNMSLYPSGNVPSSRDDLVQRTLELRTWARNSVRESPGAVCFLGNYSLPYLETTFIGSYPLTLNRQRRLQLNDGTRVAFIEVNSPGQYRTAAAACQQTGAAVASLEYTPAGTHEQFLGEELGHLALLRHWYPAGAASLTPARR